MVIKKIMCIAAAATVSLSMFGSDPKPTLMETVSHNNRTYIELLTEDVTTKNDRGKAKTNYFKAVPRLVSSPAGILVVTEGIRLSGIADKALDKLPIDNHKKEVIQYLGNSFKRAARANAFVAGATMPLTPVKTNNEKRAFSA